LLVTDASGKLEPSPQSLRILPLLIVLVLELELVLDVFYAAGRSRLVLSIAVFEIAKRS